MKTGAADRIEKHERHRPPRPHSPKEVLHTAGRSPVLPGDFSRRGIAAVFLLATIGLVAGGLFAGKRVLGLKAQLDEIRHDQELLLKGYRRYSPADAAVNDVRGAVIFTGHIYDRATAHANAAGPKVDRLQFLRDLAESEPPLRVVFGGDSVYEPTDDSLQWLRDLQTDVPMARFVLGNHDDVPAFWSQRPEAFAALFHERYWYEDLEGVRMIYLDTMASADGRSLGEDQRAFLARALDPASYRYALVFLHHALWDAGVKYGIEDPTPETADVLRRDWRETIIPLLVQGNVKGVFAGDAAGYSVDRIGDIPHHSCGWDAATGVAWLVIGLGEDDIRVTAHRLDRGRHLFRS